MGLVRCHLKPELSHQNVCRATAITWGRIAHVVMIQCMAGEHTGCDDDDAKCNGFDRPFKHHCVSVQVTITML